jgi:poly(3-hydroxybutyrate) depolymerase
MRPVYPGFLQLAGFISMKPEQHADKHREYFNHLIIGDDESSDKHEKFYDEYLSVMDLTSEFYLQTIKTVFQDFSLPLGKMTSRGRPVKLSNLTKTALLALEGEKDDIAGIGQSKAALTLAKNLSASKKHHYLQKDVGHYGIFSGSKYRQFVVPIIKDFIKKHD